MFLRLLVCAALILPCSLLAKAAKNDVGSMINVDLPKDKMDYAKVEAGLKKLNDRINSRETAVPVEDLVKIFVKEINSQVQDLINSRNQYAEMDCVGTNCTLSNAGEERSIELKNSSGKTIITLGKQINLSMRLFDDGKKLEICSLSGVKVKKMGITQNANGARLYLENGEIKEALVNVGIGGGYPNDNCEKE
ncbi:MAG: hypothetical protein HQK54_14910 [Oligoflexales bacterium]|nr:hypothetical protein [Oligoflexales bacterium]